MNTSSPPAASSSSRADERLAVLEAFVEASSDALFSQDAGGRITTWNRSAERIFGHHAAEMIGQRADVLFPAHLRVELQLVYETVMAGEQVERLETEAQRKDGMAFPISLSLRQVLALDGSFAGVVSVAQDITEKRLGQASLAEVEAGRRGGEAHAHVGRWLWDVGTGAVQWSAELHRIHGLDPADFAGTLEAHLSCIHADDRARVLERLEAAVGSGQVFEQEYRILRPDGEERWLYARGEPALSSAGLVVGLRGIGQDTTDRHRA
jgi:PAS domain S-box-containing protein